MSKSYVYSAFTTALTQEFIGPFGIFVVAFLSSQVANAVSIVMPLGNNRRSEVALFHLFAGPKTPELLDLRAGPGRLCSADSEPEDYCTWSSAQPCYRCGRFLWRDALCLVQDEIP